MGFRRLDYLESVPGGTGVVGSGLSVWPKRVYTGTPFLIRCTLRRAWTNTRGRQAHVKTTTTTRHQFGPRVAVSVLLP